MKACRFKFKIGYANGEFRKKGINLATCFDFDTCEIPK